jgi:hypothetical protein
MTLEEYQFGLFLIKMTILALATLCCLICTGGDDKTKASNVTEYKPKPRPDDYEYAKEFVISLFVSRPMWDNYYPYPKGEPYRHYRRWTGREASRVLTRRVLVLYNGFWEEDHFLNAYVYGNGDDRLAKYQFVGTENGYYITDAIPFVRHVVSGGVVCDAYVYRDIDPKTVSLDDYEYIFEMEYGEVGNSKATPILTKKGDFRRR